MASTRRTFCAGVATAPLAAQATPVRTESGYTQDWFAEVKTRIGPVLTPADVARTITFVVSQPPAVHVSDVLIRPTRQDYP